MKTYQKHLKIKQQLEKDLQSIKSENLLQSAFENTIDENAKIKQAYIQGHLDRQKSLLADVYMMEERIKKGIAND